MADRHQLQPAILLDPLHRRAERVEMGDDGARAFNLLAPIAGEDRAPAGDAMADAEPVQLLADMADDRVRVAGRAGNEIGRAHVRTPVTHAHLVCSLLLEK